MSCELYKEQIQQLLDGYLSEQETQALKRHCLTCPDCAAYLRELFAAQDALKGSLEETPPPELHTKIMKNLQTEKRHKIAPFRRFGIVAAAVLVLAVGTVAFLKSPVSPLLCNGKSADMVEIINESSAFEYYVDTDSVNESASPATDSTTPATQPAVNNSSVGISSPSATQAQKSHNANSPDTDSFEEVSETLDDYFLSLIREHLDEWTHDTLTTNTNASFVEVVHLEMIPLELEHDDYRTGKFGVEDVNIILTFGTEAELNDIIDSAYPDWIYKTNDTSYVPALNTSADPENGLFIIIVPSGT